MVSGGVKVGEGNRLRWSLPQVYPARHQEYIWKISQEEKSEIKLIVPSLKTGCESDSLCAFERMILLDVKLYHVTVNYLFQ